MGYPTTSRQRVLIELFIERPVERQKRQRKRINYLQPSTFNRGRIGCYLQRHLGWRPIEVVLRRSSARHRKKDKSKHKTSHRTVHDARTSNMRGAREGSLTNSEIIKAAKR